MWSAMREVVIANFPKSNMVFTDIDACIKHIDEQYKLDAYNSLSIEGYQVTNDLIEKVRSGNWEPESVATDMEQKNAMAARGYWQAFQVVKGSIVKIMHGERAGEW